MAGKNRVRQRSSELSRYVLHTSFKSAGIAVAPAMTLNRMYHWVPISRSTSEPIPKPPPARIRTIKIIGKSAVAGTEVGHVSPDKIRSSVDFPDPDGPRRAQ